MKNLDGILEHCCEELFEVSPYGKLETLQLASMFLMELAGKEIAVRHSGTEAMDAFVLASEFDQYVNSVRKRHPKLGRVCSPLETP